MAKAQEKSARDRNFRTIRLVILSIKYFPEELLSLSILRIPELALSK
jgi:hypothetical protein